MDAGTEEQLPTLPGPANEKSIVAAGEVFTVKLAPATLDALAEVVPASKPQLAIVVMVVGATVGARDGLGAADDGDIGALRDGVVVGEGGAAQAEKGPAVMTRTRLF